MALLRRMGGRLLQLVLLLAAASVLSFWLMQLAGSDAVQQQMEATGTVLSQQALDAARAELGLDRPVWVQYLSWLGGVLQGDLGTSYLSGQPVAATFAAQSSAGLSAFSALVSFFVSGAAFSASPAGASGC